MAVHNYYIVLSIVLVMLVGIEYSHDKIEERVALDVPTDSKITVPIAVHLVQDPSGRFTTERNSEEIFDLFSEVNRIFEQADIFIQVYSISIAQLRPNTIPYVLRKETQLITQHETYVAGLINGYFTKEIKVNGIAYLWSGFFMINDDTSVNDYRTTAHEIGHLLGLEHVDDSNRLMSQGRNGETLTDEEIFVLRKKAQQFASLNS